MITITMMLVVLGKVCQLPIRGVTAEAVREAVDHEKDEDPIKRVSVMMHELKVAYELLLDAKRHKLRYA